MCYLENDLALMERNKFCMKHHKCTDFLSYRFCIVKTSIFLLRNVHLECEQ